MAIDPAAQALNATVSTAPEWIQPFATEIAMWVTRLGWVVGGIFGLYVIFIIVQLLLKNRFNKTMQNLQEEMRLMKDQLKQQSFLIKELSQKLDKKRKN